MKAFVLIFGLGAKAHLNMNTILALVRPVFFTSGMLENTSVQEFTKLGFKVPDLHPDKESYSVF